MKTLSLIIAIALLAGTANAQKQNCFPTIAHRVTSGDKLNLVLTDSSHVSGVVGMFNQELQTLTLTRLNSSESNDYNYSDIAEIRYQSARKVKLKWVILGLVGGATIGGVIGETKSNNQGAFSDLVTPIYAVMGGTLGLFSGITLPLIFPGHETIKCHH